MVQIVAYPLIASVVLLIQAAAQGGVESLSIPGYLPSDYVRASNPIISVSNMVRIPKTASTRLRTLENWSPNTARNITSMLKNTANIITNTNKNNTVNNINPKRFTNRTNKLIALLPRANQ